MIKSNEENKTKKILKIVTIVALLLFMLPGIYFAGMRYVGSKTLSIVAVGGVIASGLALLVVGLIKNKRGKLQSYLKAIIITVTALMLLVNLALLVSPYFIPHKTTTIINRYYPDSLRYSSTLERYAQDKTVYIDKTNTYLAGGGEAFTAIDHSNRASILMAAKAIEVLPNAHAYITADQQAYLLSLKGEYSKMDFTHDRKESAYFYTGIEKNAYDSVVFLLNEQGDAYWMPKTFYDEMINMVAGNE